ncbi:hypothetical protein MtrunA17_Chr8g0354211 [Medicago truncatula]|uniref:Transmembrane protein, putative n=1 Tax=Medicago truncatula TaxID=3880 RepID=A0A072U015_MEDTR|nr:transmembrane protein, putative [Medicago truncatula]RHN40387.1 hypothetical protein MtrunA17_Chr8g0354211 [Medicago truncatula]
MFLTQRLWCICCCDCVTISVNPSVMGSERRLVHCGSSTLSLFLGCLVACFVLTQLLDSLARNGCFLDLMLWLMQWVVDGLVSVLAAWFIRRYQLFGYITIHFLQCLLF